MFSDAVKTKMPIKTASIGSASCLYVKSRFRQSYHREHIRINCVDFMGERGMQFLDKVVPVNETVVRRLNGIFDVLMDEWKKFTN